jgi:ABC-type ATPase with predicted acetyltransferase domain
MKDPSPIRPREKILRPGQRLYDSTGREIGIIRAITESGIEASVYTDIDTLSLKHAPGADAGEGYLLWRCSECGELGDLERIPDECPGCGKGREHLYAYLED